VSAEEIKSPCTQHRKTKPQQHAHMDRGGNVLSRSSCRAVLSGLAAERQGPRHRHFPSAKPKATGECRFAKICGPAIKQPSIPQSRATRNDQACRDNRPTVVSKTAGRASLAALHWICGIIFSPDRDWAIGFRFHWFAAGKCFTPGLSLRPKS